LAFDSFLGEIKRNGFLFWIIDMSRFRDTSWDLWRREKTEWQKVANALMLSWLHRFFIAYKVLHKMVAERGDKECGKE